MNTAPFSILLVDDEPAVVRHLKSLILHCCEQYEVAEVASNGLDALAYVRSHPVDLVITDIKMPVMGGVQLAHALHEKDPQLPVIIVSGYQEFEYVRQVLDTGVIEYLIKPVNITQLRRLFDTLSFQLERRRRERTLQTLMAAINGILPQDTGMRYHLAVHRYADIPSRFTAHEKRDAPVCEREFYILPGRDGHEKIYLAQESTVPRSAFTTQVSNMTEPRKSKASVLLTSVHSVSLGNLRDTTGQLTKALDRLMSPESHLQLFSDQIPPPAEETHDSERSHHFASLLFMSFRREVQESPSHPLIEQWKERKSPMITIESELRHAFLTFFERHSRVLSDGDIEWYLDQIMAEASTWEGLEGSLTRVLEHLIHHEEQDREEPDIPVLFSEICSWIDHQYRHEMSLSEVAGMFRVSNSYLSKLFRRHLDTSFTEYLTLRRIEAAKQIISEHPELPFKDVCVQVGYPDPYYFSRVFKNVEGIPPKEFANRIMEQDTSDQKDKT
ncbi:MAG: response regulator [Sphaerochaetaceae bacterium]|nr:response regulator [Sphaerochaetaceae bacterium]